MTLTYSLNNLLNIPRRFGHWNVKGYVFDDGPIDSDLPPIPVSSATQASTSNIDQLNATGHNGYYLSWY